MKKWMFLCLTTALCLLYSCGEREKDEGTYGTYQYKINEPLFISADEFRQLVKVNDEPRQIVNYGKMCFYEGYLYISEPGKGIHIIDNQNPSNPAAIGFIELFGNVDLAIRNDLLYADALIDLVWFDISNPAKPVLKSRLENVFPEARALVDNEYGYDYSLCYEGECKGDVVVGWKLVERTGEMYFCGTGSNMVSDAGTTGGKSGKNGSMSRFGLYQDYLYTVSHYYMNVFHVAGGEPVKVSEGIYTGWNIETIFSYKDCLFLGTRQGMQIYSVKKPTQPEFQSAISHVYACDPVVVENDTAYITIHSEGNFCGQNSNLLMIVDVSDVKNPRSIISYTMTSPKGLGIDRGTLFLCDDGLKIYGAGDDGKPLIANRLAHYKGMKGFDVIPYNNVLMMIAEDGLYQYDYTDLQNIRQLSKLPFGQ